jgi:hypothetical protein
MSWRFSPAAHLERLRTRVADLLGGSHEPAGATQLPEGRSTDEAQRQLASDDRDP